MANGIGIALVLGAFVVFALCAIGLVKPKFLQFKKAETPPKRLHIALATVFAPLLMLAIGGSMIDPVENKAAPLASATQAEQPTVAAPAADVEKTATPSIRTLGVTPEDFRKSYNALIGQIDKSWRVAEFDITEGSVNDTFTAKLGAAASMVGSVDKASKKLISVMVIAGGGQGQDNLQSIAVLMSTAHALTQGASKKEISDAVSALVTAAFDGMDQAGTPMQSRVIGNRKLSATASNITGLMFSVSNAE